MVLAMPLVAAVPEAGEPVKRVMVLQAAVLQARARERFASVRVLPARRGQAGWGRG